MIAQTSGESFIKNTRQIGKLFMGVPTSGSNVLLSLFYDTLERK
jgi:hypothetical protein